MEARPKIKLQLTPTDKMLEALGLLTVLFLWILVIVYYTKLPGTIPTHYNGAGQVDGHGSKSSFLILPIIGTFIFAGLTYLNKFPEVSNITKGNAEKQYTNATRMIRYLKLMIVIVFLFINYQTIQIVIGKADGLGKWFLPIFLVIMGIIVVYSIVKNIKLSNKN